MVQEVLKRLSDICLSLPEATMVAGEETEWWAFKVRDKNFVWFMNNHHGDGRLALWCKAPPGAQAMLVAADSTRYFVPPYVGTRGWVGFRFDAGPVDWDDVRDLVEESYRLAAPKRLAAQLAST